MKDKSDIKWAAATVVSFIPYGLLILLWGGTSPDNEYRGMYLTDGFYFHIENFYLYAALLFVYLLPFYFFLSKLFYKSLKVLVAALILMTLYYIYPIQPPKYSVEIGVHTVGLFHKALVYLQIPATLIKIIFYIATLCGLPVLVTFIVKMYEKWRLKTIDIELLCLLMILCFYVVMPFSYLGWEKYFVQVLPFVILLYTIYLNQKSANYRLDRKSY